MLTVRKGGPQTTVQDLGRTGYQRYGVIVSGAMDTYALRMANLLVGNNENEGGLEITLGGFSARFGQDGLVAVCGGEMSADLDGRPVKLWRPLFVPAGAVLSFGAPKTGCRAYVAVAGGIDVPLVMDSKSTYLRAEIGGFQGRALKTDDEVPVGSLSGPQRRTVAAMRERGFFQPKWAVPAPPYSDDPIIRVMPGRQFRLFDEESRVRLFSEPFTVSLQSDRMGLRLEGHTLSLEEKQELISEAVAFGSIQVPPDGQPIVLMADRQTAGGYPKIGQIASIDLPLAAQLKPGDRITFEEISVEEGQWLYFHKERLIQELRTAIQWRWREWL
ncbi:biotin-dependent carboxyltransferase family protein [Indiicoccus explosivorum]|uniref:5-oxoprolinase subunit C family protein n=1 Tax=Indiicoccus explosivorum TaxID=1917864 RepID=UPI000B447BAD|nr:biotin-dependent carboxyltransferase family protein [Indiicoccus explosivorum]